MDEEKRKWRVRSVVGGSMAFWECLGFCCLSACLALAIIGVSSSWLFEFCWRMIRSVGTYIPPFILSFPFFFFFR
jgi:hypothetical protein